jgi:RNA polymerase sigma factor (sigma-70 family)
MADVSSETVELRKIDSITLTSLCAHRLQDAELWSEFLRRFTPKLKAFIEATLRQSGLMPASSDSSHGSSDLLQNICIRLIQNHGEALKRFSGTRESELLTYLAVIARSVVRDAIRYQSAKRRFRWRNSAFSANNQRGENSDFVFEPVVNDPIDRKVLAGEIEQLSLQAIRDHSNEPARDRLIFQLYFVDGLSTAQIASCEGIALSKTGVEKTLDRLKNKVRNTIGVYTVEARS